MKFPLTAALALLVSGCGLFSNGKSSSDAPASEPSARFDAARLATLDDGPRFANRDVVWSYRLAVGDELRVRGERVQLDRLSEDVANETFPVASPLTFELTAIDATSGEILATNLAPDAAARPTLARKWQDNCATLTPSFRFEAIGDDYQGKLKLCDFAGILASPTLRLEPVVAKEDPRSVTWECSQANDGSHHDLNIVLYAPTYAVCSPGYTQPLGIEGGTPRIVELPRDLAGHSFEMQTVNTFLKFVPGAAAAKRYVLAAEELDRKGPLNLPIGKMEDCHGLEIQLLYKDSAAAGTGDHKEARIAFKRGLGASDLSWVPEDQSSLPSPAQIYAADQEQIRFWLQCRWFNASGVDVVPVD